MRRIFAVLAFVAAIGGSPAAFAATQIIAPSATEMTLEIGKGRLIRLDRPAASVFIADPKVADIEVKSPTLVYVVGKSPGQTTLFAVDDKEAMVANMGVAVRYDEQQLRQDLRRLLPNSAVGVSTANNALVLTGTVGSAADAENAKSIAARFVPDQDHILNTIQLDAPTQVNLRVRICEVSRDIIKAFGFNWDSVAQPGHFAFGLATGNSFLTQGSTVVQRGQGGVDNIFASFAAGGVNLNVLIDALDSEGLVTILAEPNLTALSGAPASFLAGGEFPVPVPQQLNVITIDWKTFGVSLNFVATITDGGRINLQVKPEVSELSTQGAITLDNVTVPSLTTRRTETTVDLASGQSLAIAGLLQNNVSQLITKFPALGNIPILGALFRSDRFERNETELVVIVTPYIVRPTSDHRLEAPTDGYIAPSDRAQFLEGADSAQQPPRRDSGPVGRSGRGLIGPIGFDLEGVNGR